MIRQSRREAMIRKQQMTLFIGLCLMVTALFVGIIFGTMQTQAAPAEVSYKYYTSIQLKTGDTLWGIAQNYMSDEYSNTQEYVDEVCQINHIEEHDIHSGQYLTIPYYSAEYLD